MSLSLKQAYRVLIEKIILWQRFGYPANETDYRIACLSISVASVDALSWLNAQRGLHKTFWSHRDQYEIFAGLGKAWEVTAQGPDAYRDAMQQMHGLLEDAAPSVRFWGGCRFDAASSIAEEWRPWPAARFVLPRIALSKSKNGSRLMAFIPRFSPDDETAALHALSTELSTLADNPAETSCLVPAYRHRKNIVEERQWNSGVAQALKSMDHDRLKKVVLARAVDFTLKDKIAPLQLLQRLRHQVSDTFHFCFQIDETTGFLGMTPELLYQRKKNRITSEALAGTIQRGRSDEEDTALAKALQGNDKEQREHLWVLDYLEKTLQPLCTHVQQCTLMECLKLGKVQHLRSRVQGYLRSGVGDAKLLGALHPTPAVAGFPPAPARQFISQTESFDRGWYAGPIGSVSRDETQFAVALRCGLLVDNSLRIYAGAGIVPGSEAAREWREIEMKMDDWNALLHPQ